MGALIAAALLAYVLVYGGAGVAAEGKSKWGAYTAKVAKKGTPGEKAWVSFVSGAAWLGTAFGGGVRNQVREDAALIRGAFTPEGRERRAKSGTERRERKASNRQAKQIRQARARSRWNARTAPWESADPNEYVKCPRCRGKGCATCDDGGTVPAWVADPDRHGMGTKPAPPKVSLVKTGDERLPGKPKRPDDPTSRRPVDVMRPRCSACNEPLNVLEMAAARGQTGPMLCACCENNQDPPIAPAAGNQPTTGGTTMPEATGEAEGYSQQIQEWNALADQCEGAQTFWQNVGNKAEMLMASAANANVDRMTLASMGNAVGSAFECAAGAGFQAGVFRTAAKTLQQQQGGLAEAHAAQPQAADKAFFQTA